MLSVALDSRFSPLMSSGTLGCKGILHEILIVLNPFKRIYNSSHETSTIKPYRHCNRWKAVLGAIMPGAF